MKSSYELNSWTSTLLGKTLVVHHTKNTILRVNHVGCSIKFWVGFSAARIRKLIKLEVKMDGGTYSRIPEDSVQQSTKALKFGRRFIFQQGNDLKHTATELEQYCSERMSKNSIIKMCNTDLKTTEADNRNPARGDPTRFNLWGSEYLYIQMQL